MNKFFKNILVFGVGGTGGYFGGIICNAIKNNNFSNITFIARGEHLKKIKLNGLKLFTDNNTFTCIPDYAESDLKNQKEFFDLILICVKEYDLKDCLNMINPHIGKDTIIIPFLNGFNIHERIRKTIKKGIVIPATVFVGTHIEKPGIVRQKGGEGIIHFGPENSRVNNSGITILKNFLDYCSVKYKFHDNPYNIIWEKYIFISTFGLMTASYNKTLGEIINNKSLIEDTRNLITEIIQIAEKHNQSFDYDITERLLKKAAMFPENTKTSFHRDIEIKDKKDERDLFCGTLIKAAKKYQIHIPQIIYCYKEIERRKPKWQ